MSDITIMHNTFKDVKGFVLNDVHGKNVSFTSKPVGSINISENGNYDVSKYATAVVEGSGQPMQLARVMFRNNTNRQIGIGVPYINIDELGYHGSTGSLIEIPSMRSKAVYVILGEGTVGEHASGFSGAIAHIMFNDDYIPIDRIKFHIRSQGDLDGYTLGYEDVYICGDSEIGISYWSLSEQAEQGK